MRARPRAAPNCFSHCSVTAKQTRHDICGPARAAASTNIDGKTARRPDRASIAGLSQRGSGTRTRVLPSDGAVLAPFGFDIPGAAQAIAAAARSIGEEPDEVWCAGGSGVLARGLAQAWPNASRHVVQIGRTLGAKDVAGAMISRLSQAVQMGDQEWAAIPERPAL